MMVLVKRRCRECGHDTQQIVGCGRPDCELVSSPTPHDHCIHDGPQEPMENCDYDHGLCTPRGCAGTTEALALVNPDLVTGETAPHADEEVCRP